MGINGLAQNENHTDSSLSHTTTDIGESVHAILSKVNNYSAMSYDEKAKIARIFFKNPEENLSLFSPELLKLILNDFIFFRLEEKRDINNYHEPSTYFEILSFFHPDINKGLDKGNFIYPDTFFTAFSRLSRECRMVWVNHILNSIPGNLPEDYHGSINIDYDLLEYTIRRIHDHPSKKQIKVELLETHIGNEHASDLEEIFGEIQKQFEGSQQGESHTVSISLDDVGSGCFRNVLQLIGLIARKDSNKIIQDVKIDKFYLWKVLSIIAKIGVLKGGTSPGNIDHKLAFLWGKQGLYDGILATNVVHGIEHIDDLNQTRELWTKYQANYGATNTDFRILSEFLFLMEECVDKDIQIEFEGIEDMRMADLLQELICTLRPGTHLKYTPKIQGYAILDGRKYYTMYNLKGELENIRIDNADGRFLEHLNDLRSYRNRMAIDESIS